ncbi:unnamed protein product [Orchesella dallaii]|uniref:Cytochrome P450 2J6 n=1 Tax=Orchesella dallaii TaxID=48710 RepID=A0ABP1QTM2_9HEXA
MGLGITVYLFITTALAGLCYFAKKWLEFRKLPPGPWGIPILGYLPFMIFRNPLTAFPEFKKRYGKVFSMTLGDFRVVVINDYKLINEAYRQDVFMGRPAFVAQMTRNHGQKRGLLFSEGQVWVEQRRFALRNLRNFGFGKHSMESQLLYEAQELMTFFKENQGKPIGLRNKFNASVLNSLWYISTGTRFGVDDPNFLFMIDSFINNMQKLELTGLVYFFPWILKNTDIFIKGFWENFLRSRDRIQGLIRNCIEEHKKTYDDSDVRDFIDAMIAKWKSTNDPKSSFYKDEGDLNMLLVLVDLFLAGAETTSSTLQWAMLYMITFPEIQTKVQQEIDAAIGSSRLPSLEDRPGMIYTEATLNEVHRFCSLVPCSVFHNTLEDAELAGYHIPKDTVILANLRDAHYDKEYWGDPENFRPERFIDETGTKIVRHDAFMPFSAGKRTCLGDQLAKDSLFIFFTCLMQKFRVARDPNAGELSMEPNAPTLIVAPKPFDIVVTSRN